MDADEEPEEEGEEEQDFDQDASDYEEETGGQPRKPRLNLA